MSLRKKVKILFSQILTESYSRFLTDNRQSDEEAQKDKIQIIKKLRNVFLFFYTIKNVDTQSNNKVIGSLSLCLSVSLSRFTFKTAEPIEIIFGGNLPLARPWAGGGFKQIFSISVHGFTQNPGKTGFYSSILQKQNVIYQ